MKKSFSRPTTFFLMFILILMLSSCASLGPQYQKVDTIPNEMGLVYIYRPNSFVGGGVFYDIKIGQSPITTLYNGGYYPYFAKPGEIEFWAETESKSSVTLDVKPGQVSYIKGTVGVGFLVGRPHLMVVDSSTAEKEILECKLIPELKSK